MSRCSVGATRAALYCWLIPRRTKRRPRHRDVLFSPDSGQEMGLLTRPVTPSGMLEIDGAPPAATKRPWVRGKFVYVGEDKVWVKGVTYGTFEPGEERGEYGSVDAVDRDLAAIAANGLNAIRTY